MPDNEARICVPVCVRRADELREAIAQAEALADILELRFDYLQPDELKAALAELARLRQNTVRPLIITYRPSHQGGFREIDTNQRLNFWRELQAMWKPFSSDDRADIEADLLVDGTLSRQIHLPAEQIICSHHDFARVPNNLHELYESMSATSAGTLKIAVKANDATDCIPILELLERARHEGRALIAIAMGPAGVMTRILGPSRGSFLTYGSFDGETATAPGQLTARELRDGYRVDSIDRQTDVMGVIGRPVSHSISPHIHNAAFAGSKLNAVFIPFEVSDVGAFIKRMVRPSSREIDWNLRGLAVTAPHKSAVMGHLNWIDPAAKDIGAVNTIVIQHNELHGYNTDAAGFIAPLKERFGTLENSRCAVIGAGGAARAVVWALSNAEASVTVLARDGDNARSLADQFDVDAGALSAADFQAFDVVVNATPLGTVGETETETVATANELRGVRLAYDLVYNPLETRFMREAREAGCEAIGGLEMLIGQAVEQFKLWTGREPDVQIVRTAAFRALKKSSPSSTNELESTSRTL